MVGEVVGEPLAAVVGGGCGSTDGREDGRGDGGRGWRGGGEEEDEEGWKLVGKLGAGQVPSFESGESFLIDLAVATLMFEVDDKKKRDELLYKLGTLPDLRTWFV